MAPLTSMRGTRGKKPRSPSTVSCSRAICLRASCASCANGRHCIEASSSRTGRERGKDATLREFHPWSSLPSMDRIPHVVSAKVCGTHSLRLTFDDGLTKTVDLEPFLRGPVFQPVRDPAYFARVFVDPELGTIVWPNGADF